MKSHIAKRQSCIAVACCCIALVLAVCLGATSGSKDNGQAHDSALTGQDSARKSADEEANTSGPVPDNNNDADEQTVPDVVRRNPNDELVEVTSDEASEPAAHGDPESSSGVIPTNPAVVELVDEPIVIIPSEAEYMPQEVLVTVDGNMDADQFVDLLNRAHTRTVDPESATWITDDIVRIGVARGFTVEEALSELLVFGAVLDAQPNYVYHVEDDGTQGQPASQDSEESPDVEPELGLVDLRGDASEGASQEQSIELVGETQGADDEVADQGVVDLANDADTANDANESDASVFAQNDAMSNDPYSMFQWGLDSINAPAVWERASVTDMTKVGVAVIDCGFDVNHEDLQNVVAPGSAYNAYRASDGDDTNDTPEKLADVSSGPGKYDHGTHVAGIISAEKDNGVGIAGVAGNHAQLVPIRAFNYDAEKPVALSSALIKAFDYVIQNQDSYNIRVINLSVGTTKSAMSVDDALCRRIDEAYGRGIVTVCSAGNEGDNGPHINWPSDWETAVGVINLQTKGTSAYVLTKETGKGYTDATWSDAKSVCRNSGSNYNMAGETSKDISAPGTDILSATDKATTMIQGDAVRYMFKTGTSMAAPHVAGVLALLFSRDASVPKTVIGAQKMVDALYTSARFVDEDVLFEQEYGHGEVDATGAWDALDNPYVDGPSYVAVGQSNIRYSIEPGLQAADTIGWTFSSANADVLQVDASTGECTAQGTGTTELIATKDEQTLRKSVTVLDGTLTGNSVLFSGKSAQYAVSSPLMSWTWDVRDVDADTSGVSITTSSGVLTAGSVPVTLTLSATLSVTKDTDNPIVASKEVYVVGALSGAGSIEIGDTTTLSLDMPEGLSLSSDALVWGSNDESVATVSDGVVTGERAGTASIWVAPKEAVTVDAHGRTRVEGDSYQSVDIMVKDSITSAQVAVADLGSQTYTGGAIQPAPVITYDGDTLWRGVEYELSYSNNVRVGLATIVITGKGCFAGSSRKVTFNIVPAKISDVEVTSIAKQAYTGKLVEPKPKLTYCGRALVLGTDYTLAYKNNKKAGTATIVIAGKGCIVGTKNFKFKIVAPTIAYRTYVQGYGWRSWAKNGKTSGTTGKARRAEAIKIKVTKLPVTGGVKYRAVMQGMGWQAWKANGATTGLANKGKRLEALQIKLTGKLAKLYNVRYRVYRQKAGWTKWAKNGKTAGSATKGRRIEAIQIKIVPKS